MKFRDKLIEEMIRREGGLRPPPPCYYGLIGFGPGFHSGPWDLPRWISTPVNFSPSRRQSGVLGKQGEEGGSLGKDSFQVSGHCKAFGVLGNAVSSKQV